MDINGNITRAALGAVASLGDLYDARRDDFCRMSIFKNVIPESVQTHRDSHFSDIHLLRSDDSSEKFSKMDVSAELHVSVLAGLITLDGSGRYLSDQKKSARTIKSSLIYNIKTAEESVNFFHEDLKEVFSLDALDSRNATHVVQGISWGANCIVSCIYENRENRDIKEIEGSLSAKLEKFSLSISGKAAVDFEEGDNSAGVNFDVRVFGDVLPNDEKLPTTIEGALTLMENLPSLVATSNDGKGNPLTYYLVPISDFKNYLGFSLQIHKILKGLATTSLARVVEIFDQISEAQQQLNDFQQDAIEFKFCIRPEQMAEISKHKVELSIQESTFRTDLSKALTGARSGDEDAVEELENIFKDFQTNGMSPVKLSLLMESWEDIVKKINFARTMKENGVTYIGIGSSLEDELDKNFEDTSVVLYFSQEAISEEPGKWNKNKRAFFQELKSDKQGHKFYVVDCDFHPKLKIENQSSWVQIIKEGEILVEDLLIEKSSKESAKESEKESAKESEKESAKESVHGFKLEEIPVPDCISWVPMSNGRCPTYNVHAGKNENNICYVARALWENKVSTIPGTLVSGLSAVTVGHGDQEFTYEDYEVLVAPPGSLSWVKFNRTIPCEAVVAGTDADDGSNLRIGRVVHGGAAIAGKIVQRGVGWFCHDGKENLHEQNLEILVRNNYGIFLQV